MNKSVALSGVITAALLLAQPAVMASESFSVDSVERKISVNMEIEAPQKAFADIIIMKSNSKREGINAANIDFNEFFYKKAYTSGGRITENIEINDSFKAGEYVMYVECGDHVDRSVLILSSSDLEKAVAQANSDKDFTNVNFGADMESLEDNKVEINTLIKNIRAQEKFTNASFIEGYIQASGIAKLMNGKLSLDEFCDLYESYFEYDLNAIEKMDAGDKEKFFAAVKNYDIGKATPEEILSGAKFVAECKAAPEQYTLIEITEKYVESNDLSFGDYKKLNSYYKKAAGSELKDAIPELNSADAIYSRFIEIAEDEYKKQEKSSEKGSSGGGGGGGGGGGATVGLYTPGAGGVYDNTPTEKTEESTGNVSEKPTAVFGDIKGHWGELYITECFNRGIINGYSDNTFKPEANISRAETAALIQRVFKISDGTSNEFADIEDNAWYKGCVTGLCDTGIIQGYNGYFRPADNVSREEMATIIYRALAYYGIKSEGKMTFSDDEVISDYARESVSSLGANGIITGDDGKFRPTESLTRAEAATLIYRTVNVFLGGDR